jgi:hypothetical protein
VHGLGEVPAVGVVGQRQLLPDRTAAPEADVGVHRIRVDQISRVEQPGRVERLLDAAEQGHRGRRVHPRQQFAAGPPVAVLARQRPAVPDHQVGRVLEEGAERPRLVQGEVQPDVHAPVAQVAVRHRAEPVLFDQCVEVP